jgi:hypothetical protein
LFVFCFCFVCLFAFVCLCVCVCLFVRKLGFVFCLFVCFRLSSRLQGWFTASEIV